MKFNLPKERERHISFEGEYDNATNEFTLSESTQAGLRCGGKTGLVIAQAQREFMDNWEELNLKFSGGIKKGELVCATANRFVGKSYFQDMILCHEPPSPVDYQWVVIDEWKRKWFSNCVLMRTKSKQARYIRVWRNK